jgi:adenylate cyclase
MLQVTYIYNEGETSKSFDTDHIVIGRQKEGVSVDLDLTPDRMVSRKHARAWVEEGQLWIEDLNSTRGTIVNDRELKSRTKQAIQEDDVIRIGDTILKLTASDRIAIVDSVPSPKEDGDASDEERPSLNANQPVFSKGETPAVDFASRLTLFYELPLQFGEETRSESLLQLIIERVVDVLHIAKRGALLVKDGRTGRLALKAHYPIGNPAVSLTMAEQAMEQQSAFIWSHPNQPQDKVEVDSVPHSVVEYGIQSAMYAPLVWRAETYGVICVDNSESGSVFRLDDLKLLQAVAHHAAMAIANLQLQENWKRQAEVQSNILKLIPAQIAAQLQQQRGRMRLGGEFRDVTILLSDIRGFTNLSATMNPDEVAEMLEDYFGRLVPIVSQNNGMVDKFVGDAILAVFGSPHADEQQQLNAIRTALEMQAAMQEINAQRNAKGKRTGELGIGINCGEVVHGFIGSNERMEFTVIGDTVNRASRYCDGAQGGEVLISPEMHQWVWKYIEVEPTSIATKHEGNLSAYRVKRMKPLK